MKATLHNISGTVFVKDPRDVDTIKNLRAENAEMKKELKKVRNQLAKLTPLENLRTQLHSDKDAVLLAAEAVQTAMDDLGKRPLKDFLNANAGRDWWQSQRNWDRVKALAKQQAKKESKK